MLPRLLAALALAAALHPARARATALVLGRSEATVQRSTTIAVLRHDRRTALSLQIAIHGPHDDILVIVPLPAQISRMQVRSVPHLAFDRLDRRSAPRLVELWEQPPCHGLYSHSTPPRPVLDPYVPTEHDPWREYQLLHTHRESPAGDYEYEVLGARDSRDVVGWLQARGRSVPPRAARALKALAHAGSAFLILRLTASDLRRDDHARTVLPPLRVDYEEDALALPLPLLAAGGPHDLVVHVLAAHRHQAVGRPNLAAPTDLDVSPAARDAPEDFYAALLAASRQPAAVFTEYAWDSENCDHCRPINLFDVDLRVLGADVLWGTPRPPAIPREPDTLPTAALVVPDDDPFQPTEQRVLRARATPPPPERPRWPRHLIHTRLRHRVDPDNYDLFLTLQPAMPTPRLGESRIEIHAELFHTDRYQSRYFLKHPWTGPIACPAPARGTWGRAPHGTAQPAPRRVTDVPHAPPDASLERFLVGDPPAPLVLPAAEPPPVPAARCDQAGRPPLAVLFIPLIRRRRPPRTPHRCSPI